MHLRHIPSRAAGVVLMALLAACGSSPAKPEQPASARPKPSGASTPYTQLADAMQRQASQADALPLVKSAYDKAPDLPDVAWLYGQICGNVPGCQPEPAEARLRRLDPKNAASWLGALDRARKAGDVAAENEILEAMSRSERFDIYWNSLVSRTAVVMTATTAAQIGPATPDLVRANLDSAVGWLSAWAVPAFRPLGDACRSGSPVTTQRCRSIANAMLQGDTYVAAGVGLSILQKFAAPGSAESAQYEEQIRRLRYQMETAGQIIESQKDKETFSRELIQLMSSLRREQDVFVAVIRWGQQPVEPPADWMPPGEL